MNRLVLFTGGTAVVAALAFFGIVISTGGRPEPPIIGGPRTDALSVTSAEKAPDESQGPQPEPSVGQPPAAAGAEATPAVAIEENAEARAAFESLAQPLRDFGLEISASSVGSDGERIVASELTVSQHRARMGWRWVMAEAYLKSGEGDKYAVTTSGWQTATLTGDGLVSVWTGPIGRMDIDIEPKPSMHGVAVRAALHDLSLQGETGAPLISLVTGNIDLNLTGAAQPISLATVARIELRDLVLPALAGLPFGTRMGMIDARVDLGQGGSPDVDADVAISGLYVPNFDLDWGAMRLAGKGSVALDAELRPTGWLDVWLENPLTALDAVHTHSRFNRDELAQIYTRLLQEMAAGTGRVGLPFTLEVRGGTVMLLGAPYGLADMELARLPPLLEAGGSGQASP